MNTILWIGAHWTELVTALTATQFLAWTIVKLTPTPKDDTILAAVIDWVKTVGGLIPHPKA